MVRCCAGPLGIGCTLPKEQANPICRRVVQAYKCICIVSDAVRLGSTYGNRESCQPDAPATRAQLSWANLRLKLQWSTIRNSERHKRSCVQGTLQDCTLWREISTALLGSFVTGGVRKLSFVFLQPFNQCAQPHCGSRSLHARRKATLEHVSPLGAILWTSVVRVLKLPGQARPRSTLLDHACHQSKVPSSGPPSP